MAWSEVTEAIATPRLRKQRVIESPITSSRRVGAGSGGTIFADSIEADRVQHRFAERGFGEARQSEAVFSGGQILRERVAVAPEIRGELSGSV